MENLKVTLSNCYGIASFDETFDFSRGRPNTANAFLIYAPNGLMKTSFARTFEALSNGKKPTEERFNRPSNCVVLADGNTLDNDQIYVLKSEIEISSEGAAVSNILVNQATKARYDELVAELNKLKDKLLGSLKKVSGLKKAEIESVILDDFGSLDFLECVIHAANLEIKDDIREIVYQQVFDPKALALLESQEFVSKAKEFNERYQELFDNSGSIYKRGVFNPTKADTSFSTLKKQGYFQGGHRVHLEGDAESIGEDDLQERVNAALKSIESDVELKKIRTGITKNAQSQVIGTLLEKLSTPQIDTLFKGVKKENQSDFKHQLWAIYIQDASETNVLLETYTKSREEIQEIEKYAASEAPQWQVAIDLFNDRFVDMPFELSLFNPSDAALGKSEAKLMFIFDDGKGRVECARSDIRALSQGEKRALYLLNFIFEIEDKKRLGKPVLFILDDIADSFDYKNKHAIVQYLQDIGREENFYQIILTHNYDFFRTVANSFVYRPRCLMAVRKEGFVSLAPAKGIKNYFAGEWKPNVSSNDIILCATVPFTRNIIEYTKGEDNDDYRRLTSLLHWKHDSVQMTVGEYFSIYNSVFDTKHSENREESLIGLIVDKADEISVRASHDGLNLEDKVLLSIAIRLKAEFFLIESLRIFKNDSSYWCPANSNQYAVLMNDYLGAEPQYNALKSLEKVSITVSSNIHLNSFMYEPILDLTIDHLISLYLEIKNLAN